MSQGTAATKTLAAFLTSIPETLTIMPLEISKLALQLDVQNIYKNHMMNSLKAVKNIQGE